MVIAKLDDFEVSDVRVELVKRQNGIVLGLLQDGEPESLTKNKCLRRCHLLGYDDLRHGAVDHGLIGLAARPSRQRLLVLLARCAAPGDTDFENAITSQDEKGEEDAVSLLAQDPIFQVAWDEMEEDALLILLGKRFLILLGGAS